MITCRKNKKVKIIKSRAKTTQSYPRLKEKDLVNFYALEIICRVLNTDDEDFPLCLFLLQEIAEKLVNIATFACQKELRHAVHGRHATIGCGTSYKKHNTKILKKHKLTGNINSRKLRNKINLELADGLFNELRWDIDYGGWAWSEVSSNAIALKNLLPINRKNWSDAFAAADILIDTYHNNDRFLNSFCTVNVSDFLDYKRRLKDSWEICSQATGDVAAIWRKVNRIRK